MLNSVLCRKTGHTISTGRHLEYPVLSLLLLVFLIPCFTSAQETTVGTLLHDERAFDGLTLFAPLGQRTTYLIDNEGRIINTWESDHTPGAMAYLLEDGSLLRTANPLTSANDTLFVEGGRGGIVERFAWDGTLIWRYDYLSETYRQHHDIELLPNGNILMIAWELKTIEEVIEAGGDTSRLDADELWVDHLIEVEPTDLDDGEIVWEWHLWDHLVQDFDSTKANFGGVSEHPELVDINTQGIGPDWTHFNSVDYNPDLDQIIVSTPTFNEIWVIDHSTSTEEAAGHSGGERGRGGDLLYRWGNPVKYNTGAIEDRKLFFQHDAHWIKPGLEGAGNILIYNNGNGRPEGAYSTIEELVLPADENGDYPYHPGTAYGPGEPLWSYQADPPTDFYSAFISGAQRLPNGNTLICSGSKGRLFEVTNEGEMVWEYRNPSTYTGIVAQGDTIPRSPNGGFTNIIFRCTRYDRNYPGFAGRDLTPGQTIEDMATAIAGRESEIPEQFTLYQNYPNPFNPSTTIRYALKEQTFVQIHILNIAGQQVRTLVQEKLPVGIHTVTWNGKDDEGVDVSSGVYFYRLQTADQIQVKKMSFVK